MDPLGGDGRHERRRRDHRLAHPLGRAVLKARRELGSPQHAQRIFQEGGGCNDVYPAPPDIGFSPEGVDEAARWDRAGEHIHPEIAAAEILFQGDVGAASYLELAVAGAERTFAPRQGDVNRLTAGSELKHGKRGADDVNPAQRLEASREFFERNPGHDVV